MKQKKRTKEKRCGDGGRWTGKERRAKKEEKEREKKKANIDESISGRISQWNKEKKRTMTGMQPAGSGADDKVPKTT